MCANQPFPNLVELQRKTVAKNLPGDRIEIIEADVCSVEGLAQLRAADVVVLHNVFEFFGDTATVDRCWKAVRSSVVRRGQRLIIVPSLEDTLQTMAVSVANVYGSCLDVSFSIRLLPISRLAC